MARPNIGVTGAGKRWSPSWWCLRLAIWLVGGRPVRISVRHQPPASIAFAAMVISGGSDISPEHYGGEITAPVKHDPDRDELEMRWIRHSLKEQIPLLGICRGAQLINVVRGGNLHQDIRELRSLTYNRPGLLPTKQVFVTPESQLAAIVGKTKLRVNSLHHQAVRDTGRGLAIVATDLDDIPQAIECEHDEAIIGVQWHPEYLFYVPAQLRLFRWLVRCARREL